MSERSKPPHDVEVTISSSLGFPSAVDLLSDLILRIGVAKRRPRLTLVVSNGKRTVPEEVAS